MDKDEDKTKSCLDEEIPKNDSQENETRENAENASELTTTATTSAASNSEMRRSTVKDLIERYFYQLQRGCGNSSCANINCASSGHLAPMTPNEAAARALQLFSQDSQLCDTYNPSLKDQRTQSTNSITSSTTLNQRQNSDVPATNITSASTSASSSRRASLASSLASTGTGTSTSNSLSANLSNSGNTAGNGPLLNLVYDSLPELRPIRLLNNGNGNSAIIGAEGATITSANFNSSEFKAYLYTTDQIRSNSSRQSFVGDSETSYAAHFPPVHYLNEQIIDELIEKGKDDGKYEQLLNAISEVYTNVNKLSRSFRRSTSLSLRTITSNTTATKLQELLGKSPSNLKKEDLRSLEGETEKDEDSTCTTQSLAPMEIEETSVASAEDLIPVENVASSNSTTNIRSSVNSDTIPNNTERTAIDNNVVDDSVQDDDDMTTDIASGSCKADKEFSLLENTDDMLVDLESLRRVKKKLFALQQPSIADTLNTSIVLLSETIKFQYTQYDREKVLHCIIVCFDMITNISNSLVDFEFLERSLPKLCHAVRMMPILPQARLTRIWSVHCKDQLHSLVQCCQQLISLHVILNEVEVQENSDVIAATKVLKIAYYASILAGESDPPKNPILNDVKDTAATSSLVMQHDEEDELFAFHFDAPKSQYPRYADDDLAKELKLRPMYCRTPVVPFEEFYNEPLSENIQMDRDYLSYKKLTVDPSGEDSHFSFMLYSFILTPATKVVGLYYDSRIRMYSERHTSIFSMLSFYNGEGNELNSTPDLKLKIRRDNIVNDALVGLELVTISNPKDLKKQLVIEFIGEQGIDEGGVSKEFFQMIVEEIFNVDFGMFMEMEETKSFWFNSTSFENDAQFTLIGIIIGLAIYNNIILAVRFPMVVYRKLMGAEGSFYDLKDFSPILYNSLKSLLDYEDDDMEDVFMQTFKISYKNVFGEVIDHELTPGGADKFVCQSNKHDFVDLYADFLLNRSIERQFEAFKKGFEMVTDESPLRLLFRAEEIELLVCGSKKFDFLELEKSTEYEGGYTKESQIIKDFWEIVHSMPEESKRKLLEFTTGSDRVPVGGLSRLKLLITRHGPDCDRLPTSHTCFNILLLPEYRSKEKLEERLLIAITYSKGFGML